MRRGKIVSAAIVMVLAIFVFSAAAGSYPEKPISLVCWSSAGSGHDLMARMIGKVMEKFLGQSIAVLNKKGGQGKVAMAYVLNKKPDGYTIMTNTRSMTEGVFSPDDPINIKSFKYISRLVIDPFVVLVSKESPFNTLQDLIDYAKQNPQKVKIGGYSVNSVDQNLVNKIMAATGTELNYIPYKGGMEPVVAVLGGHIDVAVANPSEMIANYEAGNVKVLATCSEKRFAPFDNAPTLVELGFDVVEEHWRGLMASAEVPDEVIDVLDAAAAKAVKDPEFIEFMKSSNMYDGYLSKGKFMDLVVKQSEENMKK